MQLYLLSTELSVHHLSVHRLQCYVFYDWTLGDLTCETIGAKGIRTNTNRKTHVQHLKAPAPWMQVPFRLLKSFHKIQQRLVRELEKKFSGKDVVIIANRRIMAPTTSGQSNARPRSRTLTAVHEVPPPPFPSHTHSQTRHMLCALRPAGILISFSYTLTHAHAVCLASCWHADLEQQGCISQEWKHTHL